MQRFTDSQIDVLKQTIPHNKIKIKPTGEVYLPHVEYRRILDDAFGPGAWAFKRTSPWVERDNLVAADFELWVEDRLVADTTGGQDYRPNNRRMTWVDACESAKSNALIRACKYLGIALELWDKDYVEEWKSQYATRTNGEWHLRNEAAPNILGNEPPEAEPMPASASATRNLLGAEVQDGAEHDMETTVQKVYTDLKQGTNGPYTKYDVLLNVLSNGRPLKMSTFDDATGQFLQRTQGQQVRITYKRNGKYTNVVSARLA